MTVIIIMFLSERLTDYSLLLSSVYFESDPECSLRNLPFLSVLVFMSNPITFY